MDLSKNDFDDEHHNSFSGLHYQNADRQFCYGSGESDPCPLPGLKKDRIYTELNLNRIYAVELKNLYH